jgi:hypothetical protein
MTDIIHDEARSRFRLTVDGHDCVIDYQLDGGVMTILHTGVPDAVGGRGIASDLTRAAFDTARQRGWRVRPVCSYAAAWLRRHPEYAGLQA